MPEVLAPDASEEGYGCCLGHWDEAEKGRFRREAGRSVRDDYFKSADFVRGADGQWVALPS